MKTSLVIVLSLLLVATAAVAERPVDPGRTSPGKPRPADDLYGDLYVVERNSDTGAPFLDVLNCVRPLYEDCTWIPLLYETTFPVPEEDDPCEVDPDFAEYLQAIDLGRMSVTKSPQSVVDQAYTEAIRRINDAMSLGLDPAGRLNYCAAPCDEGDWSTIDSPLENLALYQQMMKVGWLEDIVQTPDGTWERAPGVPLARDLTEFELGYLTDGVRNFDDFDRCASFLAAAADKTSFVSRDAIVTLNTFLGINVVTPGETPRDDVSIEYFSFEGYVYDALKCRPVTNSNALMPFPPEWTCPDTEDPAQCFYVASVDVSAESIYRNLAFCVDGAEVPYHTWSGGLLEFTQAVEHARSVISFLHNWSVPVF